MISKDFKSPIVDSMVIQVIRRIKKVRLVEEQQFRLDADLVPKFSMKPIIKRDNLIESVFVPLEKIEISKDIKNKVEDEKKARDIAREGIKQKPLLVHKVPLVSKIPLRPSINIPVKQPMPPQIPDQSNITGDLNELQPTKIGKLIFDPSITLIECLGPGKKINVVSRSMKQVTPITLSPQDIKKILNIISDKTKIPLQEGVFRVVFSGWLMNAVISEIIGTRFILKRV